MLTPTFFSFLLTVKVNGQEEWCLSPAHSSFIYFTALYSHGTDENVKAQGVTVPESLKAGEKNVFLTPKFVLLPLDHPPHFVHHTSDLCLARTTGAGQ